MKQADQKRKGSFEQPFQAQPPDLEQMFEKLEIGVVGKKMGEEEGSDDEAGHQSDADSDV